MTNKQALLQAAHAYQECVTAGSIRPEVLNDLQQILKTDDKQRLKTFLDSFKGHVAARYLCETLLVSGHGQTLRSTIKLLEG